MNDSGAQVGLWTQSGTEYVNQSGIVMNVNNDWSFVRANRSGFVPARALDDDTPVRWDNPQCAGDWFLLRSQTKFVQIGVVVSESNVPVIYVPGDAINPPPAGMWKRSSIFGGCSQYLPSPDEVLAAPVRYAPPFVAPFKLVR